MENVFGKNIRRLRKELNMTQADMAAKLNITAQSISKWERGEGLPDSSLLSEISAVLNASIDSLFGNAVEGRRSYFKDAYKDKKYFFGVEPSEICYEILKKYPPGKYRRILEIGCGEGKDAVFFARNGYEVTAFDIAEAGIEKAKFLADTNRVDIDLFCADLFLYHIEEAKEFDIIYSKRVFHVLTKKQREEILSHYKEHTSSGGVNVIEVFVQKPFIDTAPDNEEAATHLWKTGELFTY